jgi:hypothetical protein
MMSNNLDFYKYKINISSMQINSSLNLEGDEYQISKQCAFLYNKGVFYFL